MRHASQFLLAALLLAAAVAAPAAEPASIETRTVNERLAWGDRSLVVLDVRTPAEYGEGHVPGAVNIPHTELTARIGELAGARERDIVVYCRSGNRSAQALKALRDAGFTRLFHMKGDYVRWSEEDRPIAKAQ